MDERTHAQCDACWATYRPGEVPERVRKLGARRCCWCGAPTRSGIYVDADPAEIGCDSRHQPVNRKLLRAVPEPPYNIRLAIGGREIPCGVLRDPDADEGGETAWIVVPMEPAEIPGGRFGLRFGMLPPHTMLLLGPGGGLTARRGTG